MTASDVAFRFRRRLRRISALIRKEAFQVFRDPSSIAVGIVMPMLLLVLFGYGLSFDVKNVPVALVMEEFIRRRARGRFGLRALRLFRCGSCQDDVGSRKLLLDKTVNAIVRIPPALCARNRARRCGNPGSGPWHRCQYGANFPRICSGSGRHVAGARSRAGEALSPSLRSIDNRLWFNEANESTYFLVPGLIVLVMTLIGALLTALVMAREWERGTFEALFVTPVRPGEVLLGKIVPYFVLGMIGLALSVVGSQVLFGVPLRGSLSILVVVSMLYLLVALGIGLLISSVTKSQFVASQITLVATFLPAMMLSGFMFDLRSMPWAIQVITYIFPARYFVSVLQTLFLAGDIWPVILPNAAVLAVMATVLMSPRFFHAQETDRVRQP